MCKTLIKLDNTKLILYHGTTLESAVNLCAHGWSPESAAMGSQCGNNRLLYLTNFAENALWYANEKGDSVVVKVEVPMALLLVDPEDGTAETVDEELGGTMPGNVAVSHAIPASSFAIYSMDTPENQKANAALRSTMAGQFGV